MGGIIEGGAPAMALAVCCDGCGTGAAAPYDGVPARKPVCGYAEAAGTGVELEEKDICETGGGGI